MKKTIIMMIVLCLFIVPHISAQEGSASEIPPMMAITDGTLTLYGFSDAPQPLMELGYFRLISSAWSADGQYFAFSAFDATFTTIQLWLTDRDASEPRLLADDVSLLPVSFTADNLEVVFIRQTNILGSDVYMNLPTVQMNVYTQSIANASEPRLIAAFVHAVGCTASGGFPMDIVYDNESGYTGNSLVFEWTSYGMIYSRTCLGIGADLLNPETNEGIVLDEELTRIITIPDTATAFGIRVPADFIGDNSLMRIDLTNGNVIPTGVMGNPDQLALGASGFVYYSTRQWLPQPAELTDEQRTALSDRTGLQNLPQFGLELHRYNPANREDLTLYSTVGWGVGRMAEIGDWIYFTVVPSGDSWLSAILAGAIDMNSASGVDQEIATVVPSLYRIPIEGGDVELISANIASMNVHPLAGSE